MEEFSFTELADEVVDILNISTLTNKYLGTMVPGIFEAYNKLASENRWTDGYIMLLMGYACSLFREFKGYLGILFGSEEEDIQTIFKQ